MTVFDKKDFPKVLAQVEQGSIASLYLLYGEDYLVKSGTTHRDSRSRIPAEH